MSLPRLLFVSVCVFYYVQSIQSASLSVRYDNQDYDMRMRKQALVKGPNTGEPLSPEMITEEMEEDEITTQDDVSTESNFTSTNSTTMTETSRRFNWLKMLRLIIFGVLLVIWIAMGIRLCFQSSQVHANSHVTPPSSEVSTNEDYKVSSTPMSSTSANSSSTVN